MEEPNQLKRISKTDEWILRIIMSLGATLPTLGFDMVIAGLLCPIHMDIETPPTCWYPQNQWFIPLNITIKIIITIILIYLINKFITKFWLYENEET